MHQVQNGHRVLKFDGKLLAESDSRRRGSARWIEFKLYRTNGGTYVLSRVGVSHIYHSSVCGLVTRYGLHEAHVTDLTQDSMPCEECHPDLEDPVIYPEEFRHWTLTSDEPEAILNALYKEDYGGARYLTRVAERLLEDAARVDRGISDVYRVEYIP